MAFHVGQRVVCINDDWPSIYARFLNEAPVKGRKYTVREVCTVGPIPGLRLGEILNRAGLYADGWGEPAFDSRCFRPIEELDTDISIFTAMLSPAKAPAMVAT